MSTTTEITQIEQVIEGLIEIKRSITVNGGNKYASSILKAANSAILSAEWEKTRLLLG
jgi:hypothetical protein